MRTEPTATKAPKKWFAGYKLCLGQSHSSVGNVPQQPTCISSEHVQTMPSTHEAPVSYQQSNGIMDNQACNVVYDVVYEHLEAASSKCQ